MLMPLKSVSLQCGAIKHAAIDSRTTRHEDHKVSIEKRKQIEECFGWMKNIGLMRKSRYQISAINGDMA